MSDCSKRSVGWKRASARSKASCTAKLKAMRLAVLMPVRPRQSRRGRKRTTRGSEHRQNAGWPAICSVTIACNAMVIVKAFGLCYLGSEEIRPWANELHIAFGLAIPSLFLAHRKTGQKRQQKFHVKINSMNANMIAHAVGLAMGGGNTPASKARPRRSKRSIPGPKGTRWQQENLIATNIWICFGSCFHGRSSCE
jgi:hypothetical protein